LSSLFEQRLNRLLNQGLPHLLQGGWIGLEKETLRVSPEGHIAQTPHPAALGSALTHPYITTDYGEALLEFITPPLPDLREALQFLADIHRFVYDRMDDEMLWTTSMPCVVDGEASVRIARYGRSNAGMMKHIYRRGLAYRYGRIMQVIAGAHFNYSLPEAFWPVFQELEGEGGALRDFVDSGYFGLIRNLQRFGWLIPYLFGASPAICKSFLAGQPTALPEFDVNTYYLPYATSLRMSDIGYTNKREKNTGLEISYNSLAEYIDSLTRAIETPCSEYEKIGVIVDGEYRQLNANCLQIENEYYSSMRPKQPPQGNEKPTSALRQRGVQYVELRSLDLGAFDPLGVSENQLRFLEAFLIYCLLCDSLPIDARERQAIDENLMATANRGRNPKLRLQRGEQRVLLRDWATELCTELAGVCEALDAGKDEQPYAQALAEQWAKVNDPEQTPSARMLAEMQENGESFFHCAKRLSERHREYCKSLPLAEDRLQLLLDETERSQEQQAAIEAADTESFEEYLWRYFAQE